MTGQCEGGHDAPLRELNLVIIGQSQTVGGRYEPRRSPLAFVCNDCIAEAYRSRAAS